MSLLWDKLMTFHLLFFYRKSWKCRNRMISDLGIFPIVGELYSNVMSLLPYPGCKVLMSYFYLYKILIHPLSALSQKEKRSYSVVRTLKKCSTEGDGFVIWGRHLAEGKQCHLDRLPRVDHVLCS